MTKPRKNGLESGLQSVFGTLLRIVILIGTDLAWSLAVPLLLTRLYDWLFSGETDWNQNLALFGGMAVVITLLNVVGKCCHGSILNPGAAINRIEEIRRLSLSVLGTYILSFAILQVGGMLEKTRLLPMIASMLVTIVGFPVVRFLVRLGMKKSGIGQIRVFIAGAGKTARAVGTELAVSAYYGYQVAGYFDDDPATQNAAIGNAPWLGRLNDAVKLAKAYHVQHIVCCLPPTVLPKLLRNYTQSFQHVLIVPSNEVMPITAVYPTMIGFISGFECQNRVLFRLPRIVKRMIEVVAAFFGVILLLPLFAVLAVLVKLSGPGPIFYTAKRLGLHGRTIKVFKFRTMRQDAEAQLEALLEENPAMKVEWQQKFKLQDDPRVTKIGRFLRRTSLDELPQFINVLRGEMALVGPRPIVPDEVRYYGDAYEFFTRVRPGITGLWQVSGRNDVDYPERVALDMFYVMNWSFWLDWFILWKTVLVMLFCKGSY